MIIIKNSNDNDDDDNDKTNIINNETNVSFCLYKCRIFLSIKHHYETFSRPTEQTN